MGVCIGGHLAFRAAMHPGVKAAACFYATDIHKGSLGDGGDDSLARVAAGALTGEMWMAWGRQDPHIPVEGRRRIYDAMTDANVRFSWLELNAAHAFLRDEGPRYDPELARQCYGLVVDLFRRRLGPGDGPAPTT
jgi:carboxymethylenebutenolidase